SCQYNVLDNMSTTGRLISTHSRVSWRRSEMRHRIGIARVLGRAVLVAVGVAGLAVGACQRNGGGRPGGAGGAGRLTWTPKAVDAVMGVPPADVATAIETHLTSPRPAALTA